MSNVLSARGAKAFASLQAGMAKTYGVNDVEAKHFAATPTVEQTFHDAITLQSDFLQRINVIGVRDLVGERVFGGLSGLTTRRTDTSSTDREARDLMDTNALGYQLVKTENDVAMSYDLIDQWSKFKDFNTRFLGYVRKAIALERIMIGWHGTSAAATTDPGTNTLLQDVNKGWLQHIRENKASQMLTQGEEQAGEIRLGDAANHDFKTLDALVADLKQGIHVNYRHGGDLVAIIGDDLLAWDEGKLYSDHGNLPSEKAGIKQALKSYGGLPAMTVPHFPATGLVITSLDNLSIYWQEGSSRRKVVDNPKRDRIEDYNSRNEGYVVEDYDKIMALEPANVRFTWV